MGLVTGDGVAPARLDQPAARQPFIPIAVGVVEHVIIVFPAPELLLARDHETILGPDRGAEGARVMRMRVHVGERQEHAVDQAEIIAVAQADDLFAPAGGVIRAVPGGPFHCHVETAARRVPAADHLPSVEQLSRNHVALRHLPDIFVEPAERNGLTLARHGGQPEDRAVGRLTVDLRQHHVGHRIGEKALLADRWQLPRIAQHEDGRAEGQQVLGHLSAHHRHLVEHEKVGTAQVGMRVEHELRLMNVVEPEFQLRNLGRGKAALDRTHARQVALQRREFRGHTLDLLGRGLGGAINQAVDRLRRRALARHDEHRLASEGGKEHTAQAAGRHRLQAERLYRLPGDRGFSGPCIPKHPQNLLLVTAVPIPVPDDCDGLRLCLRQNDAHGRSSDQHRAL